MVLSFLLCWYGTHVFPSASFYLLPTRLWELLIGAALAAHPALLRKETIAPRSLLGVRTLEAIGLAGLAMVVLSFILINGDSGFPGLVSLAPTVGTGLVLISVADEKTRLSRFLSSAFMVRTGKLSYSIYLWHWPLITLGKSLAHLYGKPQIYGALAGGVVGVLAAWCAYICVEQPLRRRGSGRPLRFAVIAIGFSLTAICCLLGISRRPVADSAHRFDPPAFLGEQYSAGNAAAGLEQAIKSPRYYDVNFPPIPPGRPIDRWRTGGVVHLYGAAHPQVVVLGSSHALMYSALIDNICREMHISVAFLGVDATPVFFGTTPNFNFASQSEAQEFDQARARWLREWHPNAVFLIDRWDNSFNTRIGFDQALRSLLIKVSPVARRVFFVSQVPAVKDGDQSNLRELVTWRIGNDNNLPLLYPDLKDPLRKQAVAIAQADVAIFQNLRVIRTDLPFYKEDGSIRYSSGRSFYYADGDHLSQTGAEVVHELFQSAIGEATSVSPAQSE
jgi:hypothetical protein